MPKAGHFAEEVTAQVDVARHLVVDGRVGLLDRTLVVHVRVNGVDAGMYEIAQQAPKVNGLFGGVGGNG